MAKTVKVGRPRPHVQDPLRPGAGRVMDRLGVVAVQKSAVRATSASRKLRNFTVLWVTSAGIPFNTAAGFYVRAFAGNKMVDTAFFDNYGVASFNKIRTLTPASYTLRLYDSSGLQYRVRTTPAGLEAFAIVG